MRFPKHHPATTPKTDKRIVHELITHSVILSLILFLFIFNKFIYLFLAALSLCCCTWTFSSCGEWGLLFVAVCGLLIAVASPVAEHSLQAHGLQQLWHVGSVLVACRLSSCGARAQLLHSMWDHPRPGLKPVSPALVGRFLTTAPPGKSHTFFKNPFLKVIRELRSFEHQLSLV